jgi:hypothetical protein
MKTVDDVVDVIAHRPRMMRLLDAVEALSLPNCWIGAGFVRNAVWDRLHDNDIDVAGDVDVARVAARNCRGSGLGQRLRRGPLRESLGARWRPFALTPAGLGPDTQT